MTEYRVTERPDDPECWTDPEAHRVIVADSVSEAAVRYCERVDVAWWLDKRRGDPPHVRRTTVHVLTPVGEVWSVPIVAGVASWQYRPCDRKPRRRVRM